MPNLRCVFDVSADAEALVVVADMNDAHHLRCSVGESIEVKAVGNIVLLGKLHCDREVLGYDGVDLVFKVLDFLLSECSREIIVALRFFTLDVSRFGAVAPESFDHSPVEDMFGSVHRWKLRLALLHVFAYRAWS